MMADHFRALAVSIALGLGAAAAEDQAGSGETTSASEWAQQLGHSEFSVRESAAKKLETAGATAVPALVDTAVKGDAEAKQRALSILKRLGTASEEATVTALNEIAESGVAASAEVARSILKLVTDTRSGEIPLDELTIPGVVVEDMGDTIRLRMPGGGAIQIGNKGGGGMSRMNIKTGDGVSLIAGRADGKSMVIAIDPAGAIKMKVSAQAEGETTTKAFQYRNAEELKEKNPELFELFDRFRGGLPR